MRESLLDRFCRYVRVDTQSSATSTSYPSTGKQKDLLRILVDDLRAAGLDDAAMDEHGYVMATLPSNVPEGHPAAGRVPVIGLVAHVDTYHEVPGANVQPQVHRDYDGGDIVLPGDPSVVIRAAEERELAACRGLTIVTSDGTTLLGADDKAGVAAIMEAATRLVEQPNIPHGPVRLALTCDEEIGRGVDHLRLDHLGAAVGYTLDGQGADTIDVETFSADMAVVTVQGKNIHPGVAKGRMVNALRVAADLVARLPREAASPESSEGREGFLHPFEVAGGVGAVSLRVLLRDFDALALERWADMLRQAAAASMATFPGAHIGVAITRQYRNMAEGLAREPRAVGHAERALGRLGRVAKLTIVRGGTDG